MFLLNLSPLEFLAIFGAVSAFVVTLYLLSRSRKRQKVATLRFWAQAQAPVVSKQRRRIQQPLSLLLQILSIALLLLAIGQLQWGTRDDVARDHVLLLDTSSWMSARAGIERCLKTRRRKRKRTSNRSRRQIVSWSFARKVCRVPRPEWKKTGRPSRQPSMIRAPALRLSICSRPLRLPSRCVDFTQDAQATSSTLARDA